MNITLINSIDKINNHIKNYEKKYDKIFFITQKNIVKVSEVSTLLKPYRTYICNDRENCKTLSEYQSIIEYLASHQCNKHSLLIALGGGSVTDLCGFVASTYMRGISYVNIPTTLLGMVDASIGGKTALNIGDKRNLVGTFNDATEIIIYNKFLKSLSTDEIINGYAEIIKYALIMDKNLFDMIEQNIENLVKPINFEFINQIIQTCLNHKIEIVKQDKHDHGIRNILNFGHTVGHALESYYQFKLSHGMGVLYGMKVASYLSYRNQNINQSQYNRITNLINKLGIKSLKGLEINKVLSFINTDKKNIGNKLNYILLKDIGMAYIEKNYNKDNLRKGLQTI
jgi:3-dehydroquinate synthase